MQVRAWATGRVCRLTRQLRLLGVVNCSACALPPPVHLLDRLIHGFASPSSHTCSSRSQTTPRSSWKDEPKKHGNASLPCSHAHLSFVDADMTSSYDGACSSIVLGSPTSLLACRHLASAPPRQGERPGTPPVACAISIECCTRLRGCSRSRYSLCWPLGDDGSPLSTCRLRHPPEVLSR